MYTAPSFTARKVAFKGWGTSIAISSILEGDGEDGGGDEGAKEGESTDESTGGMRGVQWGVVYDGSGHLAEYGSSRHLSSSSSPGDRVGEDAAAPVYVPMSSKGNGDERCLELVSSDGDVGGGCCHCTPYARRACAGLTAMLQICFALFVIMIFADPFVNTLEAVAKQLSLPPFIVACIIPIVSNLNEVIASIEYVTTYACTHTIQPHNTLHTTHCIQHIAYSTLLYTDPHIPPLHTWHRI